MKPIPNYEGLYSITEDGQIYSFKSSRFLKNSHSEKCPYPIVWLFKDKVGKCWYVHRLVAITYIPNPDNLPCVNHKDENPGNPHVTNLEWCTSQYNNMYNGLIEKRVSHIKKSIYCVELDKTYESLTEAANDFSCRIEPISAACKDSNKTACGYHWQYAKDVL